MYESGRRLGEEQNGTTVSALGFETIDGVYCRKFLISQKVEFAEAQRRSGSSGMSQLDIYVWENFGARRLHRIEMLDTAWVVKELIPITHEQDNPLPFEAFNIESILQTCDISKAFYPSKRIKVSQITDVIVPNPRSRGFASRLSALAA